MAKYLPLSPLSQDLLQSGHRNRHQNILDKLDEDRVQVT